MDDKVRYVVRDAKGNPIPYADIEVRDEAGVLLMSIGCDEYGVCETVRAVQITEEPVTTPRG